MTKVGRQVESESETKVKVKLTVGFVSDSDDVDRRDSDVFCSRNSCVFHINININMTSRPVT